MLSRFLSSLAIWNLAFACPVFGLLTATISHAQSSGTELIWSEDFESYEEDYGYDGNGNSASSETEWSITYGNSTDWWCTQDISGSMVFGGKTLSAECTWLSRVIDVGNYSDLEVSIHLIDVGSMEDFDFVRFEAIVDGSAQTIFFEEDDFGIITVPFTSIANGSNLQLRVTARNDSNTERHYFDDIQVYGIDSSQAPILGCLDADACTYNPEAEEDDGSCDYNCCPGPGCCDVGMHWDWELGMCQITNVADTNLDGCVQLNDLLDVLSAYGNCTEAEVVEHPCSGGAFFPGDDLACAGWNYLGAYDGGEYYVSTFPLAWDSAQAFAAELNGSLAVISSQEENDWISDLAGDNYVWFGLYQDMSSPDYSEPGGGWLWVDDSPFVYENWATNEPNNVNNGTEHHCQMYSNGVWNDAPGDLFINSSDGRDIYAVIEFR